MNMACKKEFTRQFLIQNFNKTYINTEYKCHLKDIYFQKEISKLPETICIINACNAHYARTQELKKQKEELKATRKLSTQANNHYKYIKRLYILYDYCFRQQHYIDITTEPTNSEEVFRYYDEIGVVGKKKYIPKYIGRCPLDNCKGFINSKFLCELCLTRICEKCNVPLLNPVSTTTTTPNNEICDLSSDTNSSEPQPTHQHICDENTVSTIQLLKKDTKPCPTCHVNIFKIDGCDQMWCIDCLPPFSWPTVKIEKK